MRRCFEAVTLPLSDEGEMSPIGHPKAFLHSPGVECLDNVDHRWPIAAKADIAAETLGTGSTVTAVANRYTVSQKRISR